MKKKDSKQYWNSVYDYKSANIFAKWRTDYIVELIGKNENKISSILELGCGSGNNLTAINERFPGLKLYGLELSNRAAECSDKESFTFIAGDIKDLSMFENKYVDLILTSGSLIYLHPSVVQEILKEMIRISCKFIINIERIGNDKLFKWFLTEGIKIKMYETRYVRGYRSLGIKDVEHKDLTKILLGPHIKNTKHLIVANLTEDKLIID